LKKPISRDIFKKKEGAGIMKMIKKIYWSWTTPIVALPGLMFGDICARMTLGVSLFSDYRYVLMALIPALVTFPILLYFWLTEKKEGE
jgi:hypothetical protein